MKPAVWKPERMASAVASRIDGSVVWKAEKSISWQCQQYSTYKVKHAHGNGKIVGTDRRGNCRSAHVLVSTGKIFVETD